MDPLSAIGLTSGVVGITAHCLKAAKSLSELREKYQNAAQTISAICSESTVISASLSQVQSLLLRDNNVEAQLRTRPELYATFDTALTGCMVVFSCLEEEIQRLAVGAVGSDALAWRVKARLLWREDVMKEMLQQLRGQQMALTLLIQALQMHSLSDLQRLMRDNNAMITKVAQRSRSLRANHPSVKVPQSIFTRENQADGRTEATSTVDQMEFDFDDVVVNSHAYRRALAAATRRASVSQSNANTSGNDTAQGVENLHIGRQTPPQKVAQDLEDVQGLPEDQSGSNVVEKEDGPQNGKEAENDKHVKEADNDKDAESDKNDKNDQEAENCKEATNSKEAETVEEEGASSPVKPTSPKQKNKEEEHEDQEKAPPLPPRRPSAPSSQVYHIPKAPESSFNTINRTGTTVTDTSRNSTDASPSIFSHGSDPTTNNGLSLNTGGSINESNLTLDFISFSEPNITNELVSNQELEVQSIWQTILLSEVDYINKLETLRTTFSEPVSRQWPVLSKHLEALGFIDKIIDVNVHYLMEPLRMQLSSVIKTDLLLPILRIWCRKAAPAYRAYYQRYPHCTSAIRTTYDMDQKFRRFVKALNNSNVFSLKDRLADPMRRIEYYCQALETVTSLERGSGSQTTQVIEHSKMMVRLRESCEKLLKRAANEEELRGLHRRINSIDFHHAQALDLLSEERQIIHQGPLACKANGKGSWFQVHCVLLDNYLFWGRVERPRESWFGKYKDGEKLWVLEAPMPVKQLRCILETASDGQVRASIIDNVPRGSVLFPFSVKAGETGHVLAATTREERQEWVNIVQTLTI